MDLFYNGIPVGRFFGITVRLHFTFLFYVIWRIQQFGDVGLGFAYMFSLFFCILLHEFGHALAARWCDGDADEILLWPLGGLAFCRPAFHPTAHLITAVAGPFVTLVLWLLFWALSSLLPSAFPSLVLQYPFVYHLILATRDLNLWLLIFNMIPAFPMDGGRILRDIVWRWTGVLRATELASSLSRVIAVGGIIWAFTQRDFFLGFLAFFIFSGCSREMNALAYEAGAIHDFSVRERLKRGFRQHKFRRKMHEATSNEKSVAFHRCAQCGRTDRDEPSMDFRVCSQCSGDKEYCPDHLKTHKHS